MAVLADDDDRLHVVLENLGLLPYFDFVLTSREVCCVFAADGMDENPCLVLALAQNIAWGRVSVQNVVVLGGEDSISDDRYQGRAHL